MSFTAELKRIYRESGSTPQGVENVVSRLENQLKIWVEEKNQSDLQRCTERVGLSAIDEGIDQYHEAKTYALKVINKLEEGDLKSNLLHKIQRIPSPISWGPRLAPTPAQDLPPAIFL
jgi:hypothetical protein